MNADDSAEPAGDDQTSDPGQVGQQNNVLMYSEIACAQNPHNWGAGHRSRHNTPDKLVTHGQAVIWKQTRPYGQTQGTLLEKKIPGVGAILKKYRVCSSQTIGETGPLTARISARSATTCGRVHRFCGYFLLVEPSGIQRTYARKLQGSLSLPIIRPAKDRQDGLNALCRSDPEIRRLSGRTKEDRPHEPKLH